jgi:hypothetical protein
MEESKRYSMSIPMEQIWSNGSNLIMEEKRIPKDKKVIWSGGVYKDVASTREIRSNRLREVYTILE